MGHTASILGAGGGPGADGGWEGDGGVRGEVWEGEEGTGWTVMDVEGGEQSGNGFAGRLRSMTCADEEAGEMG